MHAETMSIEIRIASKESSNVRLTIFDAKRHHVNDFGALGPKYITFANALTQKYPTDSPVCACPECHSIPLGEQSSIQSILCCPLKLIETYAHICRVQVLQIPEDMVGR